MLPSYLVKLDRFQKLDSKEFLVSCAMEGMKTSLYENFLNFKQKLKLVKMDDPQKKSENYLKQLEQLKSKLKGGLSKK